MSRIKNKSGGNLTLARNGLARSSFYPLLRSDTYMTSGIMPFFIRIDMAMDLINTPDFPYVYRKNHKNTAKKAVYIKNALKISMVEAEQLAFACFCSGWRITRRALYTSCHRRLSYAFILGN